MFRQLFNEFSTSFQRLFDEFPTTVRRQFDDFSTTLRRNAGTEKTKKVTMTFHLTKTVVGYRKFSEASEVQS